MEGGGGDIGMSQLSCGWNPRLGGSDITRTVLYSRQDGADERSNEQNVKPRQILPLAAGRWMDAGMGK